MRRKWITAWAFIIIIGFSACKEDSKKVVSPVKIEFKKEGELQVLRSHSDSLLATFDIEIADNEYERQTGLMNRQDMQNDQAMLFIFDEEDYRSFYMKNTYIPLDIIYLDDQGEIISFQYDAKPMDETSLPSISPAKYVLEIKAGLSEKFDIQIDDKIKFTRIAN